MIITDIIFLTEKRVFMKTEFVMKNGVTIPAIGYGTWRTPDGETCVEAVKEAIAAGYTHIDTAAAYGNEASVGEAIRQSGVDRKDLFITSKVWNSERGYDKVMAAFNKSLELLGTDYLDLFLIHWPANHTKYDNWNEINLDSWRAMIDIYKSGKARSIGVSNFMVKHLTSLLETEVPPMVNQIEAHPGHLWEDTIELCQKEGIVVEAWSPLGSGRIIDNELLAEVGSHYGKSASQVSLRWLLQHDILPLPKSLNAGRMRDNLALYDFEISSEDMNRIDEMKNVGFSGSDPDEVTF